MPAPLTPHLTRHTRGKGCGSSEKAQLLSEAADPTTKQNTKPFTISPCKPNANVKLDSAIAIGEKARGFLRTRWLSPASAQSVAPGTADTGVPWAGWPGLE